MDFNPSVEATISEVQGELIASHLRKFLDFPKPVKTEEGFRNPVFGRFDFHGVDNPHAYGGEYKSITSVLQGELSFLINRFEVEILRSGARALSVE